MTKKQSTSQEQRIIYDSGPGWFVYFLCIIGAAIFFISQANGFWDIILAILKSIVWPGVLVFELFSFII